MPLPKSTDCRYRMEVFWSDADQAFLVRVPELSGCMADGATYEEAVANAQIVIGHWIETARELGREVPQPQAEKIAPVVSQPL